MPLPEIANVIRVGIVGHGANNVPWANILHIQKPTGQTYADAIAALDPILLSHYTVNRTGGQAWASHATPVCGLDHFTYTPLDGTSASTVVSHAVAGGDSSSVANVPSLALVVSLRTPARGRRNRGRVYESCWRTGDEQATGVPAALAVSKMLAQWNGTISALTAASLLLVVASYGKGKPPRLPNWTPYATVVTSISVDGRWDTQRRRLG